MENNKPERMSFSKGNLMASSLLAGSTAIESSFKTDPKKRLTNKSHLPALGAQPSPETEENLSSFTYAEIDVDSIDANEFAPRTTYSPKMLRERATSLDQEGQLEAIHVIENPSFPGRYIIGDGWTRVQSAKIFKVKKTLLAKIYSDKNELEIAQIGFKINQNRNEACDFDTANFAQKLAEKGLSQREIASSVNLSQAKVSQLKNFFDLPDEILELMPEHGARFPLPTVAPIAQALIVNEEETLTAVKNYVNTNDKHLKLIATCKAIKKGEPIKKSEEAEQTSAPKYSNFTIKASNKGYKINAVIEKSKRKDFEESLQELLLKFGETVKNKTNE